MHDYVLRLENILIEIENSELNEIGKIFTIWRFPVYNSKYEVG